MKVFLCVCGRKWTLNLPNLPSWLLQYLIIIIVVAKCFFCDTHCAKTIIFISPWLSQLLWRLCNFYYFKVEQTESQEGYMPCAKNCKKVAEPYRTFTTSDFPGIFLGIFTDFVTHMLYETWKGQVLLPFLDFLLESWYSQQHSRPPASHPHSHKWTLPYSPWLINCEDALSGLIRLKWRKLVKWNPVNWFVCFLCLF